jgi:acyl-CoA synthetase (AMP-forming)/AMP-acid ligase II
MSIVARVIDNANRMPSQDALRAPGSTVTYRELADVASAVASWLQSRDIEQGDRVALRLHNCPLYVAIVLGAWQVGAVVVPVSTRTGSDGHRLGTVSVMDTEPRRATARELAMLHDLAGLVTDDLELRQAAVSVIEVEQEALALQATAVAGQGERAPAGPGRIGPSI